MKTKLLPIVAILSAMSFTAQADNTNTSAEPKAAATPAANNDIKDNGQRGYVIDSDGDVVRDSWGACVRTIEWTEETEIARCEGKEETVAPVVVAPAPIAKPAPVVIAPVPVAKPAPKPIPTIAQLRGFFDTESATLKSSAKHELDLYADFMTANPNTNIRITGHTDSRGEASYNQQLSEKRADAVKAYLVNKGISANRMTASGEGESNPTADNNTREGRAHNRRVDVELVK
ncbi:Outer membrane protein A precursor [hydrothermal vent metagenome]|uniref:Outer membrane protein A n=1 Tax=hydrothermal vent metagenome TaxID=652676 RepID=A0A3B0W2G7_9ZZZZ